LERRVSKPESTPRFPALTLDTVTPGQRPLAEQIVSVSSIGLGGPYGAMLRSPVMGQRMFDLLAYLRWKTTLPLRLNEFAILIIGRQWRSQVEWFAHVPIALKAGLSERIIAELKTNARPSDMQPDEAITYDLITELTTTHALSDATYARAKALFTEQQIVDLTAVAGTYITIAMFIAMADMKVPDGREPPFKPGEP
jgi:4-carboxymuconolactone decarboxylase